MDRTPLEPTARKAWTRPKVDTQSVIATRGGSRTTQTPGDDLFYRS